MFSWEWPWIFLLLPAPLLVRFLLPARSTPSTALRAPFLPLLRQLAARQDIQVIGQWHRVLMLSLVWILLLAAVARPLWIGDARPLPREGRDLMLVVDISPSMAERDMALGNGYTTRIEVVKSVIGEFIAKRSQDRIGLILFGEQAYLQTPLTFDHRTVLTHLNESQLGFAGNATAIGDALGLGIKRLLDRPAESRVVILLTDGANNAGSDPREAALVSAEADIRIHTVAIAGEPREITDIFGLRRTLNPSADLDEETLIFIAETTGGRYFRAHNPRELDQIYDEIDRLEPAPEAISFRPQRSLFHWPLGAALLISLLMAAIPLISRERVA